MSLLIKLIALFIYPVGLTLLCAMAGVIALYFRKKYAYKLFLLSSVIVALFSFPLTSKGLIRILENQSMVVSPWPSDCSAIVILGGSGMQMAEGEKYPEINDAGDRIIHGARLFKDGVAPRIITTGGYVPGNFFKSVTEGAHNAMLLRQMGVDSSAIIIEPKAKNTRDHGPYIATILDSLHLPKRIILVTTASHMPRSIAVFKKYGYTVFPAPTDFHSKGPIISNINSFFPNAHCLELSTIALHEIYGFIGYKILGWI